MTETTESNQTDNSQKAAKTTSIFIHGDRLYRATSAAAVRKHLTGEIKISKATGEDVAKLMGDGGVVQDVESSIAVRGVYNPF